MQGRFNNNTAHSLHIIIVPATSVVGVMKIGNTVPRAGIECTSSAFQATVLLVLLVHHKDSLMSPLYPYLHVYAAPCLRVQCSLLQLY